MIEASVKQHPSEVIVIVIELRWVVISGLAIPALLAVMAVMLR